MDARALLLVVLGCRTHAVTDVAEPPKKEEPDVAIVDAPAPGLEGLLPDGGWMQVIDEGKERIHVAVPTGATSKRPVIVGVHGAQDRPDWACAEWFGAVGGRAFVVCPRGSAFADGFVWSSADAIVKGAERALEAARKRFGAWMHEGPALYGGWSQASSLGFEVLKSPLFDAAVLVEIHTTMSPQPFAEVGKRLRGIAVVCSTGSCEAWSERAREPMKRAGTRYEAWTAGHRGHTFDGEVSKRVSDAVAWVTSGDPHWDR